jgi:hypothetical protein
MKSKPICTIAHLHSTQQDIYIHNSRAITHYILSSSSTSVACAIGPSVNPLQNRETQHVNIVLQCLYPFFEQPNMKGNHA